MGYTFTILEVPSSYALCAYALFATMYISEVSQSQVSPPVVNIVTIICHPTQCLQCGRWNSVNRLYNGCNTYYRDTLHTLFLYSLDKLWK